MADEEKRHPDYLKGIPSDKDKQDAGYVPPPLPLDPADYLESDPPEQPPPEKTDE